MTDLPKPPPIVSNAIHSWVCWLNALPPGGPPTTNTCGSEEKKYALYTTKKLQAQYHDPEIRPIYDRAVGEKFNMAFGTLSLTQKNAIRWAHLWGKDLKRHMRIPPTHMATQLRAAYHALAARL